MILSNNNTKSEFEQPPPVTNDRKPVWEVVRDDMAKRDNVGRARYGTPLQPFNGRDALRDAYEEALDLVVYLRQAIIERDEVNAMIDKAKIIDNE